MSDPRGPKQTLFEQLAVIASALGSAARLEILDFLAQGERSVEDLATVAGSASRTPRSTSSSSRRPTWSRRDGMVSMSAIVWRMSAWWRLSLSCVD
jgi:DNA-binding transcriptional ArsR family regulator